MPDSRVRSFYDSRDFLLVGMSRRKKNFAWSIYKNFINAGRKVYVVHPEGGEKDGVKFYSALDDLPEKPEACIVCTDLKKNSELIPMLADSGIEKIWFQQGSYNNAVLETASRRKMNPIKGCVLMYLPEASFGHKVHRFFHDLFTKGKN
jgi:predicted CoA-binding protein